MRSATLWSITGTYSDVLARQKFAVFVLVCSVLVPNAAGLFRQTLRDERFQTNNRKRTQRILRRDKRQAQRENRGTNRLVAALLQSLGCEKNEHLPFPAPHWTGEPRPRGARRVQLHSNFPSPDYLRYLVNDLGYDGHAAIAALSRGHVPWTRPPADRRRANACNADEQAEGANYEYSTFSPAHPYIPAAPTLRTTKGGGFKKEKVTAAIAKHHWDDKHATAVFEIVYMRREPFLVAASLGLKLKTVYRYCMHVRADLKAETTFAKTSPLF